MVAVSWRIPNGPAFKLTLWQAAFAAECDCGKIEQNCSKTNLFQNSAWISRFSQKEKSRTRIVSKYLPKRSTWCWNFSPTIQGREFQRRRLFVIPILTSILSIKIFSKTRFRLDKSIFPGQQSRAVPAFDEKMSKANAIRGLQLVNWKNYDHHSALALFIVTYDLNFFSLSSLINQYK